MNEPARPDLSAVLDDDARHALHRPQTASDLILQALRRWPDRVAFVEDERELTYRQTLDLVARIGQVLREAGVDHQEGVAQLGGNRLEIWPVMAGILVHGARYTPLHPLGSTDDHAFILDDGEITTLVYNPTSHGDRIQKLVDAAPPGLQRVYSLGEGPVGEDLLALAAQVTPQEPRATNTIDDICWLGYTGGTTGRSKGVVLPHRCWAENVRLSITGWEIPLRPTYLAVGPLSHAAGGIVTPVLVRGGTVVVQPGFKPDAFCEAVQRHDVNLSFVVPSMLYALLDSPVLDGADLSSLETVIYGASPMSPSRMTEAMERIGPVFQQLYAQTEAPNTVLALLRAEHDPDDVGRLTSAGRPMAGVEVAILDDDDREVEPGGTGQLCVRGPIVMDGYWKRPDATAETLRNGWLHTGDMATADADGYITLVDRAKDMIISGGFNVYPREIEDVLTTHEAVAQAAVIGVPDPKWGEAVKACVVLRPETQIDHDTLEGELKALVKDQKGSVLAPKSIDLIESLPLTAVGKVDKKALRAPYWQGQTRQVG